MAYAIATNLIFQGRRLRIFRTGTLLVPCVLAEYAGKYPKLALRVIMFLIEFKSIKIRILRKIAYYFDMQGGQNRLPIKVPILLSLPIATYSAEILLNSILLQLMTKSGISRLLINNKAFYVK